MGLKFNSIRIVTRTGDNGALVSVRYIRLDQALKVKRISKNQLEALQAKGLTVVIV